MPVTLPIAEARALQSTQDYLSTNWATYCTLSSTNFIAGHRYLIMAVVRQMAYKSESNNDYRTDVQLQYNSVDLPGCASYFGNYGYNGSAVYTFMMTMLTPAVVADLVLRAKRVGAANSISHISLMTIDLDCDAVRFPPQSERGWLFAEDNVQQSHAYGSWLDLSGSQVNFTPDGVSDYLVIGDMEFQNGQQYANGFGYGRLLFNDSAEGLNYTMAFDWGMVGCRQHLNVMHQLTAPAAVPMNVKWNILSYSPGYPFVNSSRIFVLRLNAFTDYDSVFSGTAQGFPPTGVQTMLSKALSASPPVGSTFLTFRRMLTTAWVAALGQLYEYSLREQPSTTVMKTESWDDRGTVESAQHAPLLPALYTSGVADPTLEWTSLQFNASASNTTKDRLLVAIRNQLKDPPLVTLEGTIEADSGSNAPTVLAVRLVGAQTDAVSALSGDAFVTSSRLVVDGIDVAAAGGGGGDRIVLRGNFPQGQDIRVYVGPTQSVNDPEAHSGISGQKPRSSDGATLVAYLPVLPPGVYPLLVVSGSLGYILEDAITIVPSNHKSGVFGLRAAFSPLFSVGPRSVDRTPR